MIAIEIDARQLKRLQAATAKARKSFPSQLAAAINDVARKTKVKIGKDVRSKVEMSVAVSQKPLKAKQMATAQAPKAIISIAKTPRLGLQHFKAKQDKKGVSYKISKQGGKVRINGAFMGPRPGMLAPALHGGVFIRTGGDKVKATKGRHEGKMREPIMKLRGVSAFGAYAVNNMDKEQTVLIRQQLHHQMERRIRQNILRANGIISK